MLMLVLMIQITFFISRQRVFGIQTGMCYNTTIEFKWCIHTNCLI